MNRTRAFTLIEMVVVIGLIILLAGLTLSVGVSVIHQSEARQTRAALLLLDSAVQEWELQADRKLTWCVCHPGYPDPDRAAADIHGDTKEVLIITEVLKVITKSPSVREIIAKIDPKLIYRYKNHVYPPWIDTPPEKQQMDERFDGAITVLDAWGFPIYATHAGRPWDAARDLPPNSPYQVVRDPDGTIQTYNEVIYGVATNRRMCFVSSGPDGRFGDLHQDALPPEEAQYARDNLYSYPIKPP